MIRPLATIPAIALAAALTILYSANGREPTSVSPQTAADAKAVLAATHGGTEGGTRIDNILGDGATLRLTTADGQSLRMSLPTIGTSPSRENVSPSLAIYPQRGRAADVAIQALGDGSVRTYLVINNQSAPTEYRFKFDMPVNSHWVTISSATGQLLSLQSAGGSVLAQIMPAWAIDANGSRVRTSYRVVGSEIVQSVEHVGARYPVVADPWYSFGCCDRNYLPFVVVHFSQFEAEVIWWGGWGAAYGVAAYLCGQLPWWAGSICGLGTGAVTDAIWSGLWYWETNFSWCGLAVQIDWNGMVGAWPEC